MSERVLITGGAGFIGSHLADELLDKGYQVRALDNLAEQVHGPDTVRPSYLHPDVELLRGDMRDPAAVRAALEDVEAVFHLAAMNARGELVTGVERHLEQLKAHEWEVRDLTGEALTPVPTPETKTPALSSVYALSKHDQERLCLLVGRAYGIPTVALRFFNVYGTRQALSNPYTGVLAIFASRLLNRNPPLLFEDGRQMRDFGDIRHCFADITLAQKVLGFKPQMPLEQGLRELASWLEGQVARDRVAEMREELAARGLTV